jgi:hypothetical protein
MTTAAILDQFVVMEILRLKPPLQGGEDVNCLCQTSRFHRE